MFLFEVGQEVTVFKVTYEIKARFDSKDKNYYTVMNIKTGKIYTFMEESLFTSTVKYQQAKTRHEIVQLQNEVINLKNSLSYYKSEYTRSIRNRYY